MNSAGKVADSTSSGTVPPQCTDGEGGGAHSQQAPTLSTQGAALHAVTGPAELYNVSWKRQMAGHAFQQMFNKLYAPPCRTPG